MTMVNGIFSSPRSFAFVRAHAICVCVPFTCISILHTKLKVNISNVRNAHQAREPGILTLIRLIVQCSPFCHPLLPPPPTILTLAFLESFICIAHFHWCVRAYTRYTTYIYIHIHTLYTHSLIYIECRCVCSVNSQDEEVEEVMHVFVYTYSTHIR